MLWGGAVLTLTFLFVALIPVIGPFVVIMTPLPVLYYASRLDRLRGGVVLACALLASWAILEQVGPNTNLPVLLVISFTGLLFSEVLKRHLSIEKTFLVCTAILSALTAAVVAYHALLTNMAPWKVVGFYVEAIVRENINIYSQLNIGDDQVRLLRDSAPQMIRLFTGIFPALALAGIVLTIWLNLLAARRLFWANGLPFPDFGDLAAWKAPERLVWVLIAAGAMTILPGEEVTLLGMNLLILCATVYLFQGLSIASFFFRQKRVPALIRWLFYGLLLIQQYLLLFVIACGLFDMWVDFRKRIGGVKDAPV
jgi:uncharacterized protein YybS (DUF2232 family)